MNLERRAGVVVGTLLLIQMAGSAFVNFGLQAPLFGEPGFLVGAAAHASQIGLSALVGIALGAVFIGIAITLFPIIRAYSLTMALWMLVIGAVVMAIAVMEQATVMSMVTLSEAYAKAPPETRDGFRVVRIAVGASRNWPHFLARVLDVSPWIQACDAFSVVQRRPTGARARHSTVGQLFILGLRLSRADADGHELSAESALSR